LRFNPRADLALFDQLVAGYPEVWVKGAHRFRNPDEDLPQDFDVRREEYYAVLEQPREARAFVEKLTPQDEIFILASQRGQTTYSS